jgi:ElaB/YqjD/DUF883 family membrane-anchored ribosome-binding protein
MAVSALLNPASPTKEKAMENQFRDGNSSTLASTAARIKEQVGERAASAKDAVVDFGRKTVENFDAQRGTAAGTLDQTASALHDKAEKVAGAARVTADKLHATADYVRTQDFKAMTRDVEELVRRYPGPALAIAAAVGFVTARMLRTQD